MNKLRVIFIHGISSTIIKEDYSAELRRHLLGRLEKAKLLPSEASLKEQAEVITFESLNYSSIGHAQEERVLQAYLEERERLFNFADALLDKIILERLRREVITSVSDVLIYQSDYWRTEIRRLLLEKINPYVKTGDAVTLIGHSLGSVVAFDVAYYNSRHNAEWLEADFKPTNLFTLGSPVALFSLEMDAADGRQKPRHLPTYATPADRNPANTNPDTHLVRENGVWYNFMDAQDLVAYPLEILFKAKFAVKDIVVQNGTEPIKAHSAYWSNKEVAERIAERLVLDYQRLKVKA